MNTVDSARAREIAIIGGTGLARMKDLQSLGHELVTTPFGEASGPLTHGRLWGHPIVFLPRHGYGHTIPPHRVNYRANLWALHHVGVRQLIAVNAVGLIRGDLNPGDLVLPDQLIDYTHGREHTFFDGDSKGVEHVDFTEPYCPRLREALRQAARSAGVQIADKACYGATQGPRLETSAEIHRMERDGCDLVGMTGMPEAALARELGLDYVCVALGVNRAAGRGATGIHAEMEQFLDIAMDHLSRLLPIALDIIVGEATDDTRQ